ncbi:MAG: hypothetical protein KJ048_14040 [Dehalococcoidia bacterium]|jgi:hypothetical protein|nr:hypothetical protein [Dehalococcoidia bacterium]
MKRPIAITGLGAVIVAAAVAGGVGVAFALGGGDDADGHGTMTGMTMQMDPATMESHMREMMGDDAFETMQEHMLRALGEEGYAGMLDRMADGCSAEGMAMSSSASDPTDHLGHHPGSASD